MKSTLDLRAVRRRTAAYERPRVHWSGRRRWRVLAAASMATDVVALGAALAAATVVRFGWGGLAGGRYGSVLAGWLALWWLGLAGVGLYDLHVLENPARELRRVTDGVTIGAAFVVMGSFAAGFPLSRGWLVIAWLLALGTTLAGRRAVRKAIHALRRRGRLRRRALIVGADATGRELADAVARAPWEGIEVVGFVATGPTGDGLRGGDRILGTLGNLRELAILHRATEVLVSPGVAGSGRLGEVVAALDGVAVDLRVAPGLDGFLASRLSIQPLGDRSLVAVERVELRPGARAAKRVIDVVFGSVLIATLVPVMAGCALAVRLSGRGPVFFRQTRVGIGGRRFSVWKFRSMVADAEERRISLDNGADGLLFKVRHDPRITRVGRFLRRTSLDELPQLINVVRGDMSLVGPRPPLPEEVERYDSRLERRLLVKPGITGLWQVSGRSELSFDDYVRYDLLYVQNWSIALDLYIMLRTIPAVMSRRGAY